MMVNADVMLTYVSVRDVGGDWPWTGVGFVSHRPDMTDLAEPYLSAVISARGGPLWFWKVNEEA